MQRRHTLARGALAAVTVTLAAGASAALGAGGPAGPIEPAAPRLLQPGSPASRTLADEAREQQAAAAARRGGPPTAGERAQRAATRRRHVALSAGQATALYRGRFGRSAGAPALDVLAGEDVQRFLNPFLARVDDRTSDNGSVVVTSTPIAAPDAAGRLRAVDLDLEARGDGFAPRRPAVALRIPRRLDDGIAVGGGLLLRPDGAASADPGRRVGGSVLFPNAGRDADVAVRALPGGVELFDVLRSERSPERLSLRVHAGGARVELRVVPGGDLIEVRRGGDVVGHFEEAHAIDAEGRHVATRTRVRGDRLVVEVPHRGRDLAYPLLVDPPFVYDEFNWQCGTTNCDTNTGRWSTTNPTGWKPEVPAPTSRYGLYFSTGYLGTGFWVAHDAPNTWFPGGEEAYWRYIPPGTTRVSQALVGKQSIDAPYGTNACMFSGILAGAGTGTKWESQKVWCGDAPYETCCGENWINENYTHTVNGTLGNSVAMGTVMNGSQNRNYFAQKTGYVKIQLTDDDWPELTAPVPAGWSETDTLPVSASDPGTGVQSLSFTNAPSSSSACDGTKHGTLCPRDRSTTTGAFAEGVTQLSGTASDGAGNVTRLGRGLRGAFYDTGDLTGRPFVRTTATVDFNWGTRSPDRHIGVDTYSARFTGQIEIPSTGTYTFYSRHDDGVRLWVDGQLLVDDFVGGAVRERSKAIALTGGRKVDLTMDYTEHGGPSEVHLSWSSTSGIAKQIIPADRLFPMPHGLTAEHYDTQDFTGRPVTFVEGLIDDDWGAGSPDLRIGVDTFSSRYTGTVTPRYTEDYTFITESDDGVRLVVDGEELIDDPTTHPRSANQGQIELEAGKSYDITLEHFEATGSSSLQLAWSSPSQPRQVIPTDRLRPAHPPTAIKVDKSAPTITLGGPLAAYDGQPVPSGTKDLTISAKDGDRTTPSSERSGVQRVEVAVDDEVVWDDEIECPEGSCGMDRTWTFDSEAYPGGEHVIDVTAIDGLGHEKTSTITVTTDCCLVPAAAWGTMPGNTDLHSGDFDGDGHADVLGIDRSTRQMHVALSTGEAFAAPQAWGTWPASTDVHVGDLEADGDADVFGRAAGSADVRVAESTGTSFTDRAAVTTWPTDLELHVGDVDGDEAADLVGRRATGEVVVAYGDVDSFEPAIAFGQLAGDYQLHLGDVDGEGEDDLVGFRPSDGDLLVGTSTADAFEPTEAWGALGAGRTIEVADVDGDGPEDVVARTAAGQLQVASSTAEAFAPERVVATWPGEAPLVGDVDADDRADAYGRATPLPGLPTSDDVSVALSRLGPVATAIEDPPVLPDEPDEDEVAAPVGPSAQTAAAATAAAAKPPSMHLTMQEDGAFLTRAELPGVDGDNVATDGFTGASGVAARDRLTALYKTFKRAGFTRIRFFVHWGEIENYPGAPTPYAWGKLDEAVNLALDNGIHPYFTVTGWTERDYECKRQFGGLRNQYCRGETGLDPDNGEFETFMGALFRHFTTDDSTTTANECWHAGQPDQRCVRVRNYGVWNEPNLAWRKRDAPNQPRHLPSWFLGGGNAPRACQYVRYMRLFEAASRAAAAYPAARLMIGELAAANVTCMRVDENGAVAVPRRREKLSPMRFLDRALANRSGDAAVRAAGVAIHPYQHRTTPVRRDGFAQGGVHSLSLANRETDSCTATREKRRPRGVKQRIACLHTRGLLASSLTTGATTRAPFLFVTEFGYHSRPTRRGVKRASWHTERERAAWLHGWRSGNGRYRYGALDRARFANAKMFVQYEAFEIAGDDPDTPAFDPTYNAFGHDTGLMTPTGDFLGTRPYGKDPRRKRNSAGGPYQENAQPRLLMCAYQRWANLRDYKVARMRPRCPKRFPFRLPPKERPGG